MFFINFFSHFLRPIIHYFLCPYPQTFSFLPLPMSQLSHILYQLMIKLRFFKLVAQNNITTQCGILFQKLQNVLVKKTRFDELFTWIFDNFTFILTSQLLSRRTLLFHKQLQNKIMIFKSNINNNINIIRYIQRLVEKKYWSLNKYLLFLIRLILIIISQRSQMSRKNQNNQLKTKNISERSPFLIDDDSNDSKPYCYSCVQYQQDISLLQSKLMETHNKLIEQIDICREQEMKIIKLSANNKDRDGQNNFNAGNRQQAGKLVKKNDEQYMHSIEPLIQAKTELLRNDLEAMRNKVLSEISKTNRLKEENQKLEAKHQAQLQQYRQKIKKLQANRNKIVDDNQKLSEQLEKAKAISHSNNKPPSKCVCGYEHKYFELDKAFMNQRLVTNQLIEENNSLQNRIQDLYQERAKSNQFQNRSNSKKAEQIRTQPKKRKTEQRKKLKEQFEATKNLIKQLEEAESEIRKKHNSKH